MREIFNQLLQLLQQGIAAIFRFVQVVWTWTIDQVMRVTEVPWSAWPLWKQLILAVVAAAILYGYITILVIIAAYVIHIPFAIRTRRFLAEHPEVWDDKPRQQRAARRAIRRASQPQRRRSMSRLGLSKPGR